MTKRLLIITRHIISQNNGGANASKGFIHCMAAIFENCTLICPVFEGKATDYIPSNVKVITYEDRRSRVRKGLDCWRGRICANETFVKAHLKEHTYDVIVVDHSFSGASLVKSAKATRAKIITIHHNVERNYNKDNKKNIPLLCRFPFVYFANKAERECLAASDLNLTLTKQDASVFRTWGFKERVHYWGTFEYRQIEDKIFTKSSKNMTFAITGSLCFEQSVLPILDFIKHYWPLVLSEYPKSQLIIAGRNPGDKLIKTCAQTSNSVLIPNPEKIDSVIKDAAYYICPINAGSGLKLRVMDGLRQGKYVLCHEVSSAGYDELVKKDCLFIYSNKATFIDALHTMLSKVPNPAHVYHSFRTAFSLETGIKRLVDILRKEQII